MRLDQWQARQRIRLDIAIGQTENLGWQCVIGGIANPPDGEPATFLLSAEDEPVAIQGFGRTPNDAYACAVRSMAGVRPRLSIIGPGRDELVRIPRHLTAF